MLPPQDPVERPYPQVGGAKDLVSRRGCQRGNEDCPIQRGALERDIRAVLGSVRTRTKVTRCLPLRRKYLEKFAQLVARQVPIEQMLTRGGGGKMEY